MALSLSLVHRQHMQSWERAQKRIQTVESITSDTINLSVHFHFLSLTEGGLLLINLQSEYIIHNCLYKRMNFDHETYDTSTSQM